MKTRISMLAATATVATMALLGACGSSAQPQSPATSPASQAATPADSPASATSATSAEPSTAAPSTAATSSSDPSQDAGQVKSASEKFVKSALTLGYPDTSSDAYLARLKPLMTEHGFAAVKKSADASQSLKTGITTLSSHHGRSTPKFTSDAKVSSMTADKATTKLVYKLTTQQQTGGKWKTLRTSPEETVNLQLVHDGGRWVVDDAS